MYLNTKVSKYFQIVLLIIISIILTFWDFIDFLPGMKIERILGIAIAIMGAMFMYFDSRLSDAIPQQTSYISHKTLADSFNHLAKVYQQKKHKKVKHLRIFALSSARIHSILTHSSTGLQIERCTLFLKDYSDKQLKGSKLAKKKKNHIWDFIGEWENDQKNYDRIATLKICHYLFFPTEYYVIFDDESMILGWYLLNGDQWAGVQEPLLIRNKTEEGKELIRKFIKKFDRLEELYNKDKLNH
jgi:hypothetical protein